MTAPLMMNSASDARSVWYQRVLILAVANATVAVTMAARSLLFVDEGGALIVLVALVGLAASSRSVIPFAWRTRVNSIVLALSGVFIWGYLAQVGIVATMLAAGPQVLIRFTVFEWVRALLMAILWFTAFRCFVLFSPRDWLLTLVPDMSALLLVCVLDSFGEATPYVVWFAVSSWLAIAAEQRLRLLTHPLATSRAARQNVLAPETRASLASVAAALVVAFGLSTVMRGALAPGNDMQAATFRLAWYLSRLMVDFSRTPSGGYGGPMMVGATAPPMSNQVALRVTSPVGGYWRGACYEEFDGAMWTNTRARRASQRIQSDSPEVMKSFALPAPKRPAARRVYQSFEIATMQMGTILSSGLPVDVRAPITIGRPRITIEPHGTIFCSQSFTAGHRYQVTALVPVNEEEIIASAPPDAEMLRACRSQQASPRTRALARRLTQGLATNVEKARAIERYLLREYPYSLAMPPMPRGKDTVDYFLFEAKAGYCVQFAAAMAILCRVVGVPSRLVTGYAPGDFDPVNQQWVVRDSNAHAWVEVWARDNVWQRFDPTGAGGPNVGHTAFNLVGLFSAVLIWLVGVVRRIVPAGLTQLLTAPLALAGLTLLGLGALALLRRLRKGGVRWRQRRAVSSPLLDPRLRALLEHFLRCVGRRQRVRLPEETLGEYVRAIAGNNPQLGAAAGVFIADFEWLRYGSRPVDAKSLNRLRQALNALEAAPDRRR